MYTTTRVKKPIVIVTGNKNKLSEFKQMLGDDFPCEVVSQDVDLPEYQGEPEDIARSKCELAAQTIKGPCLTEDTSLCFNALGGMPGPYIKWFLKPLGPAGLHKMLTGFEDKTAEAVCIFAYSSGEPNSDIQLFVGRTTGTIVEPRGPTNFGWDPCFQPDGFDQTYAEISKDQKNTISHRGKAMQAFKDFIMKQSGSGNRK
ncbi:inosine triphosphate pyrophosphatase-like [Dreissena polymorpha]|uniref:Inosine triphosphate pyrophosphatase n=1 Tax=Dreissena polymorpha TaxID=45954 RepID=A0A9D4L2Z8_DREPO|nr:inosine triphosphate pyrophosphatase-like [Dreissena polymorpha]XP_052274819.1 inosine triphosphate pyrophosphatase-like [Dreissena polymorpha]KAH3850473.1 hypothetical protein DPMN_092884 [Dreissena polymorpha]KAH3850480.1 hypothetical protein DPMN_092891 [Dreissena polymorpha]